MAINLKKNGDSLRKTWQQVFDDSSDVNWWVFIQIFIRIKQLGDILSRFRAVFGYDGKTNDLKVVETGGMYYGSFVAFDMIYLNLKCYCSFITLNVMG